MLTMKQLIKAAATQLGIGVLAYLFAWFIRPNPLGFIAFFVTVTLVAQLISAAKQNWNVPGFPSKLFKAEGLTILFTTIIFALAHSLKGYGLLGFLVIVLVIAAWRIKQQWNTYLETITIADDILHGRKRT